MKYEPLSSEELSTGEEIVDESLRKSWVQSFRGLVLGVSLLVIAIALSALSGYFIGMKRHTPGALPPWALTLNRAPIGYVKKAYEHSQIYAALPPANNETEPAWNALIPKGQGFVRYPASNEEIGALSFVHQIHCLYAIRRGMFREPGVHVAGMNDEHMEPKHLGHCFDYLRQSILCAADSTIEPYTRSHNGVTGWGFPRVCRSFEELYHFAEKWRVNDLEGFTEHRGHPHPHGEGE